MDRRPCKQCGSEYTYPEVDELGLYDPCECEQYEDDSDEGILEEYVVLGASSDADDASFSSDDGEMDRATYDALKDDFRCSGRRGKLPSWAEVRQMQSAGIVVKVARARQNVDTSADWAPPERAKGVRKAELMECDENDEGMIGAAKGKGRQNARGRGRGRGAASASRPGNQSNKENKLSSVDDDDASPEFKEGGKRVAMQPVAQEKVTKREQGKKEMDDASPEFKEGRKSNPLDENDEGMVGGAKGKGRKNGRGRGRGRGRGGRGANSGSNKENKLSSDDDDASPEFKEGGKRVAMQSVAQEKVIRREQGKKEIDDAPPEFKEGRKRVAMQPVAQEKVNKREQGKKEIDDASPEFKEGRKRVAKQPAGRGKVSKIEQGRKNKERDRPSVLEENVSAHNTRNSRNLEPSTSKM